MFERLKDALKSPELEEWIVTIPNGEKHTLGTMWKKPETDEFKFDISPTDVFKAYHDSGYKDIDFWYPYLIHAIEESILRKRQEWITEEAWRSVEMTLRLLMVLHNGIEIYGKCDPQKINEELLNHEKYLLEARPYGDWGIEWRFRSKDNLNLLGDKLFGTYWISS